LLPGWTVPPEWLREGLRVATEAGKPGFNVAGEVDRFRDYWVAKPGKEGRKTDWLATWRNWVRKACDGYTNGASGKPVAAGPTKPPPKSLEDQLREDGML
jgi:hypothetical protein